MQQLKTGILYTAIGRYSNVVLSIVISAVLSRILSPDNYGVVAILQIFIFFFALLVDAGLGPAIIQNKTLTQEDTKILFNYSIIFAIFLSVLFGFAGRFISVFYQNPVFITLAWVQSLSVLFNGLNVVPTAILNKNKRFKEISLNSVISNIAGGIVGISLAFLGARYYALIASAITVSFIGFVLNRHRANISISKSMNLTPLKQVWNFARNQLGFNFINYFSRNSDNILIGRYMG
ncbi:MAG: oligosaccharide flippase family protein, partial [Streptococcaceae bacterium]|nr:oligosaccharide flippase family protein [Streptococcaceae bacterium]